MKPVEVLAVCGGDGASGGREDHEQSLFSRKRRSVTWGESSALSEKLVIRRALGCKTSQFAGV